MIRFFARSRRNIFREGLIWLFAIIFSIPSVYFSVPTFRAEAAVAPNGTVYYGELDTPADKLRFQNYTDSSNTFGGEIDSALPGTASGDTNWVVSKASPVRNEQITAFVQDGTTADLFVVRCVGDCNAAVDFSSEWSNAGVGPVLACDTTFGSCNRSFDVDYEQLTGRAMVVYGDNVAAVSGSQSKVYYCLYDGTSWSPVSNCAPTDGTNSLPAITNFDGIPKWIRLIPLGEQLGRNRSDRILALVATATSDLAAWIWNGTNWTSLASTLIANGTLSTHETMAFDGAWETNSGDALVLFGNSTTEDTTPAAYKIYTTGSNTWDSSEAAIVAVPTQCTAVATTTYISRWIELASSPAASSSSTSDIIIAALNVSDTASPNTTSAFFPYHWSGSVWAAGGGTGNSTACDDVVKSAAHHNADVAFEKYNNGTEFGIAVTTDGGTALTVRYTTFTAPSTWAAIATAYSTTDDSLGAWLFPSPNAGAAGADRIHEMSSDVDCTLHHARWSGTAWAAANPATGTGIPPDCANSTTAPHTENPGFTWVNKMYGTWQKNWRWYKGTDTTSIPSSANAYAAENTRPKVNNTSGTDFRLRVNFAELTDGAAETDSRKKLQYVSAATCSDPNTCANSSWTDVGQSGSASIWRYSSLTCSPTPCTDNTILTGTVLTDTNGTCTAGNGCGTWVTDGLAATSATAMDHNAGIVQENEYIIENNGAAASTIYYFRLFDIHDNTAIFRQQNSATACAGSTACTYPSLDTSAPPIWDQDSYRWRSDDGAENAGTSLVAENTKLTGMVKNTNYRLRVLLENTGGADPLNARIDWASRVGATCDTDESYASVPDTATTQHFEMTLTSNYADGAASTNVTTGSGVITNPGAGTFQAGELVEETSNSTGSISFSANTYTEIEYNFIANNNATDSGEYCFRLSNVGTALDTYTRYALVSIAAPAGPTTDEVLRHGNWWSSGTEQDFFWAR